MAVTSAIKADSSHTASTPKSLVYVAGTEALSYGGGYGQ